MKINYKLIGEGKKTVLFLHGWGGNLNSFLFCFNSVPTEYKILTLDFFGFGESDKLIYPFNIFDYTIEVYKLLKKLEISSVSIVAHSFGGRVAILLGSVFNIKVDNLMLVDSAGIKPKFSFIKFLKLIKYKFLKYLNKYKIFKINLNKFGSIDYKKLNLIEKQSFNKIVNFNEKKYLKKINAKTIIFWGKQDNDTPLYMAKIMHKKINNSRLIVLNNAGHFSFLSYKNLFLVTLLELLS